MSPRDFAKCCLDDDRVEKTANKKTLQPRRQQGLENRTDSQILYSPPPCSTAEASDPRLMSRVSRQESHPAMSAQNVKSRDNMFPRFMAIQKGIG